MDHNPRRRQIPTWFTILITLLVTLGGLAVPGTGAKAPKVDITPVTVQTMFLSRPDIEVLSSLSEAEFTAMAAMADTDCFSETGNCISGIFRDRFWANGGIVQNGFPISGEFDEVSLINGKTYKVQYFERAEFELHPENAAPNNVLLTQNGRTDYGNRYFFLGVGQFLQDYYAKCSTTPGDLSGFIGALNAQYESRKADGKDSKAGTTLPATGGTVPRGSAFWGNTEGKNLGGNYATVCKSGTLLVGYAYEDLQFPAGGRTIRIDGFFDRRMLIEDCPCIR